MSPFLLHPIVFVVTVAVDFAWTKYMLETAARRAHPAAFWSAAIVGLGGLNVLAYTTDHWLLIPAALGAYVGTWYAVRRDKLKNA